MRNYRFKFTIALGIGAICGMLWTPVKLVHAEQQTSNIIAETEADQEPAAGYVKIEENSSGPELYSDYDIAMYSTDLDRTMQSLCILISKRCHCYMRHCTGCDTP